MKKTLFTCFLALLCLPVTIGIGSPSSAWSKVAESPPAGEFQSPAILRGGDARPDTFLTQFEGPEVFPSSSLSTLDGGPTLRSSVTGLPSSSHRTSLRSPVSGLPASNKETASLRAFARSDDPLHWKSVLSTVKASDIRHRTPDIKNKFGLVDPDQDMGAGEGTSSLQPAPVTVLLDRNANRPEGEAENVDFSSREVAILSSRRQKENSPSAQEEEGIPAILYGEISDYGEIGPVTLHFWPILLDPGLQNPGPETWELTPYRSNIFQTFIPAFDRQFRFSIPPFSEPAYISLSVDNRKLLDTYLIMPGDSIMVRVDRISNTTVFTGPSAPLFRCQQELQRLALERKLDRPKDFKLGPQSLLSSDQQELIQAGEREFGRKAKAIPFGKELLEDLADQAGNLGEREYLSILDRYRYFIGDNAYSILKANALSSEGFRPAYIFYKFAYPLARKEGDPVQLAEFENFFQETLAKLELPYSPEFIYSYEFLRLKNTLLMAEAEITGKKFTELAEEIQDKKFRSKLVTGHFLDKTTMLTTSPDGLKDGLALVTEDPYLQIFESHFQRHIPGAEIPDFELENTVGERVKLSQYRGKTILMDFWLTGCKACMAFRPELDALAQSLSGNKDLVFLSVSVDRNRSGWEKSVSGGKYSLPGAIQLYTSELGHDHPLTAHFGISMVPHVLLIGPDGKLIRSGFYPMNFQKIYPYLIETLNSIRP